jgi:hypothetical protein
MDERFGRDRHFVEPGLRGDVVVGAGRGRVGLVGNVALTFQNVHLSLVRELLRDPTAGFHGIDRQRCFRHARFDLFAYAPGTACFIEGKDDSGDDK